MKKLSILALSAVVSITPAFAELNSTTTPTKTTDQEIDLSFAFDDIENLQVVVMTDKEMMETEGTWATTAFGTAVGGAGYAYGAYKGNYKWNTGKFIGNVASGAVIGVLTGGAGNIASGGAKFIPSLTNAVANTGVNKAWRR